MTLQIHAYDPYDPTATGSECRHCVHGAMHSVHSVDAECDRLRAVNAKLIAALKAAQLVLIEHHFAPNTTIPLGQRCKICLPTGDENDTANLIVAAIKLAEADAPQTVSDDAKMTERFYVYLDGYADRPHKENLTIDEVMEYAASVELTKDDQKLKIYRPDIFDATNVRKRIEGMKKGWSVGGWGDPAFAVARDSHSGAKEK